MRIPFRRSLGILAVCLVAVSWTGCGWFGSGAVGRTPFGRVYRVGIAPWILDAHQKKVVDAFVFVLESNGYRSGSNLDIRIEDAGGSVPAQERILRDYIAWKADLIYAMSADGVRLAAAATTTTPIVFSGVAFPLELGIIERMEFSSNNLVGIRSYVAIEEQMALLQRLVTRDIRRVGVCMKSGAPDSRMFLEEIRVMALKQGVDVLRFEAPDVMTLNRGLAEAGAAVDAFYLSCDDLMQGSGARTVIDYATRRGIPILSCGLRAVEKGALGGVVTDEEQAGRIAGAHAVQMLSGRSPTSLQTRVADPPKVVVNRTAARGMDIHMIPSTFLGEEVRLYE